MQRGKDEVTGQRRLRGDLGRLQVADLADEDDVGILAQQGAQQRGEFQVDVGVDLALGETGQLDLHGILNGGNVQIGLVDLVERGVERGRLARAGRTRDKDD